MLSRLKKIIKLISPPILLKIPEYYLNSRCNTFSGDYASWSEAMKDSSGYDSEKIVSKVKQATIQVINGEAAYERDSVLFYTEEYDWSLISYFQSIALQHDGKLSVLDYGGALGSTYLKNRHFLDGCLDLNWTIVEQPNYVKIGKQLHKDTSINFYFSLEEALKNKDYNVILLSCVLPYLERPYETLDLITSSNIEYVIIDRHPLLGKNNRDILTVQTVAKNIYDASYPAWFFARDKFIKYISDKYKLINESSALDQANYPCQYKCFFLKRSESHK